MNNNDIDFSVYNSLTFDKPDTDTFYALKLAFKAGREGGILPCIFNSADEAAVELFIQRKLKYLQISEVIDKAMSDIKNIDNPSVDDIFEADKLARKLVYDYIKG